MLVDSHCHLDCLDLEDYDGDIKKSLREARAKGVEYILCPGISLEGFSDIIKIVEDDDKLFAAVGVHPTEEDVRESTLEDLLEQGQNKKVVAIGETGLDYYYMKDKADKEYQHRLFNLHIQAAKYLKKPLIIHARDADGDIIKTLIEAEANIAGGVMHCFTGSLEMAKAAIEQGFLISFSGIVTFKNAQSLRNIAKQLPLEKILIETDAPFLAPTPYRGKPNFPEYLPYIANVMAELFGVSFEFLAKQTTENFLKFCKI